MASQREEIQVAAMMASMIGSQLNEIDSTWEGRPNKNNVGVKIDPRLVMKNLVGGGGAPIPPPLPPPLPVREEVQLIPQANGDAPLPIPVDMANAVLAGRTLTRSTPIQPPPLPPVQTYQPVQSVSMPSQQVEKDNQLIFSFNTSNTLLPKDIVNVQQLAKYTCDRLDIIEDKIKIIMSFMTEIRKNTTKKSYKKNVDEA